MIANSNSTIAPEVLATFHQRRNAGESLQVLAKEAGMTWQRLWVLMVSTQPKEMLPAVAGITSEIKTVSLTDRTHRQFKEVLGLVSEGHANIMLVGPAGTGKTTLVKHVAKALERSFAFISLSAGVTETHIFGRMLPQADGSWAYVESPFIRIYRNGGVFLFDEVDAADGNVMVSVNAALANGMLCNPVTGEVIERHVDTIIVTAGNTYGRGGDMVYVGRNALDGATTDRFVLSKLFVSYDTELEYDMLKASLSQSDVDQVFDWVRELRIKIADYRLRRIASTRLIEQAAKAMKAGKTLDDVKARYFQDWTRDEIAKVGEAVQYA
jgi:MoxR-like ATPase